jgi:hypothetical protein
MPGTARVRPRSGRAPNTAARLLAPRGTYTTPGAPSTPSTDKASSSWSKRPGGTGLPKAPKAPSRQGAARARGRGERPSPPKRTGAKRLLKAPTAKRLTSRSKGRY